LTNYDQYIVQIIFFVKISISLSSCSGGVPLNIEKFARCSEKPNCVSIQRSSIANTIEPIYYKSSHKNAKKDLFLAIKIFGSANVKNTRPIHSC
jgi:uncharacterized protein (DUF1499 family)